MKKPIFVLAILSFCFLSLSAQKFGHISSEEVMQLMRGFDTAQAVMQNYQLELQKEGETMLKELDDLQKSYDKDAAFYTAVQRKIKEDEIVKLYTRIQEFQQEAQKRLEEKKYQLLLPFQDKILEAIKEVAKEEKFTYIFNKAILSYSSQGEDITNKVKAKLGIKL